MSFFVRFAHLLKVELGVNLGRCDGFVTQELLDRPQVSTAFQQVDRVRVPENVRTDVFRNPALAGVALQPGVGSLACERLPAI